MSSARGERRTHGAAPCSAMTHAPVMDSCGRTAARKPNGQGCRAARGGSPVRGKQCRCESGWVPQKHGLPIMDHGFVQFAHVTNEAVRALNAELVK